MSIRVEVDPQEIETFCRKWGIREMSMFGSVLRDDFGPGSDVDILVELEPNHGLNLYDWIDMIEELERVFGRKVDLVAKSGLKNPLRRGEILRSAEAVYAS